VFIGAAFIGGMMMAGALRSKSANRSLVAAGANEDVSRNGSVHAQARDLWNNVQMALVGVASEQINGYISELVPGFDNHYRRAEERLAAARPVQTASSGLHAPD
jgi:hypothetical protein